MLVLWTRGDIAKRAQVHFLQPAKWHTRGLIAPVARTAGGVWLFESKQVQRFLATRSRRLRHARANGTR
jgi:hypothetical protein